MSDLTTEAKVKFIHGSIEGDECFYPAIWMERTTKFPKEPGSPPTKSVDLVELWVGDWTKYEWEAQDAAQERFDKIITALFNLEV